MILCDEREKIIKNMKLEDVIENIVINREKKKPLTGEIEIKPYESEWKKKIKSKKEILSVIGFIGIGCAYIITMTYILLLDSFCTKSSDYYLKALSASSISEKEEYIEQGKKWKNISYNFNIYKKIFDGGKEHEKE